MRLAPLLLFAVVVLPAGCATLIAGSGTDLTRLETRTDIQARLGKPSASGVEAGEPWDEYRTRRKIAEPGTPRLGEGYAMLLCLTCGAADLVIVPHELYLTTRRTVLGQTLRITYTAEGKVGRILLDGEPLRFQDIFADARPSREQGRDIWMPTPPPAAFPPGGGPVGDQRESLPAQK